MRAKPCATPRQRPLTPLCIPLRSLSGNVLCGIYSNGNGTYTAEGIIQLAGALEVNKTLQSIEYAIDSNLSTI